MLTYHQLPIPHITPQEGWVEQDPILILHSVVETINVTCDNLRKLEIDVADMVAVGITNQRETTLVWDRTTGKPLYNALGTYHWNKIKQTAVEKARLVMVEFFVVWLDMRTASTVDGILAKAKKNKNFLKPLCGLPLSTYFSAVKLRWLMDNVEEVRTAIDEDRCLFGTIDTWIIWVRPNKNENNNLTYSHSPLLSNAFMTSSFFLFLLLQISGKSIKVVPADKNNKHILNHPLLLFKPIKSSKFEGSESLQYPHCICIHLYRQFLSCVFRI